MTDIKLSDQDLDDIRQCIAYRMQSLEAIFKYVDVKPVRGLSSSHPANRDRNG